jgi:putative nucleotidyltransferase with HDIG domain
VGKAVSDEKQSIRRRVEKLTNIPTLPGILEKISPLMDGSESAAEDIARIISSDQVLSAKILRVVNSVFYGFPGRISSLTHALIILGFDVVKGLMLSTTVFDMMLAKGLRGLWEHSLGCAVTAGIIARKTDYPNPEEISIAALLHDIGKLVIRIELPEESSRIDEMTAEKQILSYDAEEEILGLNHATVGGWLCKEWHLPSRLSDPITYHHTPDLSKSYQRPTAIVHAADVLVRGIGFGFPGDTMIPQIDQRAWELLNISDPLLEEIIQEMYEKLEEAEDFLSDGESGI